MLLEWGVVLTPYLWGELTFKGFQVTTYINKGAPHFLGSLHLRAP